MRKTEKPKFTFTVTKTKQKYEIDLDNPKQTTFLDSLLPPLESKKDVGHKGES